MGYNLSLHNDNMKINQYNIAGIGIELKIPFECREEEKFAFFKSNGKVDISIEFEICKLPLENKGVLVYSSDIHVFRKKYTVCIEHFVSFAIKPYAWLVWDERTPEKMRCFILEENVDQCRNMGHLFQLIRLEQIFMYKGGLILHSAFIEWQKKGILFTAPSGTGKSTQAELWRKYQDAEIINGDRAVLRRLENSWQASGLPYAGSSKIFRNESWDIGAIVVLRQGTVNEIQRLRPVEAFKWIYSELIIRHWDETYQHNLMELLSDLAVNVPVYLMKCLPDESAVNKLKSCLESDQWYQDY